MVYDFSNEFIKEQLKNGATVEGITNAFKDQVTSINHELTKVNKKKKEEDTKKLMVDIVNYCKTYYPSILKDADDIEIDDESIEHFIKIFDTIIQSTKNIEALFSKPSELTIDIDGSTSPFNLLENLFTFDD